MLGIYSLSVLLVLHETLLVTVLMMCSGTILWKEERSRIRAVHMDNLRRMNRFLNVWIRQLYRVTRRVNEGIIGVFLWFDRVERMKNDRSVC